MDDPKPTYRAIFGAYWRRLSEFVEPWWLGFGLVQLCVFNAVYIARNPAYSPVFGQQTGARLSVGVALVAFVVTVYYEFL